MLVIKTLTEKHTALETARPNIEPSYPSPQVAGRGGTKDDSSSQWRDRNKRRPEMLVAGDQDGKSVIRFIRPKPHQADTSLSSNYS